MMLMHHHLGIKRSGKDERRRKTMLVLQNSRNLDAARRLHTPEPFQNDLANTKSILCLFKAKHHRLYPVFHRSESIQQ